MDNSQDQTVWSFRIEFDPSNATSPTASPNGSILLSDFELFTSLAGLVGREFSAENRHRYCYCGFKADENSHLLQQALELLGANGWTPVISVRRANERRPGEFAVTRWFPPPTDAELDAAPFLTKGLCLEGGWGVRLEGDVLHAKWEDDIGHPKAPVVDVRGKVLDYPTAWTQEAQQALADAGMMGADFAPIVWYYDDPLVKAHTHYLRAKHCFPRSRTPRCVGPVPVDDAYLATHGEPIAWEWDDEGGRARMFYRKSDVDRMAGIDIARTLEDFPAWDGVRRPMPAKMIFSQRFRRWADAMGYGMKWLPIQVIDDWYEPGT